MTQLDKDTLPAEKQRCNCQINKKGGYCRLCGKMRLPEKCTSSLATRPILYTDTLNGEQTLRDDLWAVTTTELNNLEKELAAAREEGASEAEQKGYEKGMARVAKKCLVEKDFLSVGLVAELEEFI